MKIIVLGGYGIFGGRLCQLLAVDHHLTLLIAGRSAKHAAAFCRTLPTAARCDPLAFDRDKDVDAQIARVQPDLIIDASGPFQSYGEEPYRLVESCIRHGVNYMDVADGSA